MSKALYKTLNKDGLSPYAGFDWPKPTRNRNGTWIPGEWVEEEGELELCENGIHYCKGEKQLMEWLEAEIYEIEVGGEIIEDDDKCVARKGRLLRKVEAWNERTARLFAADCAEHVLHLWVDKYPYDDRPQKAIDATRAFANGNITREELAAARAAARYAAWAAARDASWAAARDAAAARAAARYAAWAAARDAAWAAARNAAAARAAAWYAAWDAARAAAREREWQAGKFREYLEKEDTDAEK